MNDGRSATPESRVMSNAASTSARVWPFSRFASTTSLSDSTAETRNAQPVRANSGAAAAPLITRPGEFFKVAVSDGVTLDGWMIKPANFDSTRVYPLLMYVYGEPAGQTAVDSWSGGHLWEHMIADQGYVVATVDNRGTPAPRGRAAIVHRGHHVALIRDHVLPQVTAAPGVDRGLSRRLAVDVHQQRIDPRRVEIRGLD